MNAPIVIAVLNARYAHTALGVRCLVANMGELRSRTVLEEFLIQDDPERVAEQILSHRPTIVGISLSIWNMVPSGQVISIIKRVAPDVCIIVGGPEVRWAETPPHGADVLIRGEAETVFPGICTRILEGNTVPKVVDGGLPDLTSLVLPYDEYDDDDLSRRIIYVESSRGCPFGCEFCLSSREDKLRRFDIDRLLEKLETLIARGCKGFKFIDRTFNVDEGHWSRILDFFYEHWPREDAGTLVRPISTRQAALGSVRGESFFLHFEVVPDRFDDKLIESLARFPAGGIQLEVGIQTLDPVVGERIGRRVDAETVARNLSRLKSGTGVHIHADLIIGLPGEDENGFGRSFDSLRAMNPDEIQLGILKLLPGAPIIRHADTYSMTFNPTPPYDVLQTDCITYSQMQHLKRTAKYYDIFVNSGKFKGAMNFLMSRGTSSFRAFSDFSSWIYRRIGKDHAVSQPRQYEAVLNYLTNETDLNTEKSAGILIEDFLGVNSPRYMPECLRPYLS